MPNIPITIFISYARTDMKFVDQLEEDLKVRGFGTWVDRRKLEGGQDWLDDIQKAIEQCQVLLIALSPDAVVSRYVLMEYRHALRAGKTVIPLEYRSSPKVPMDLNGIQWINFMRPYGEGLNELLVTLAHHEATKFAAQRTAPLAAPARAASMPLASENSRGSQLNPWTTQAPAPASPDLVASQPAPAPRELSSDELYREGLRARSNGDLEGAVAIWQQIFDRDPNFKDGTFASQREKLLERLHPQRVARLREIAEEVSSAGEWEREISAWEALLKLEPNDQEAKRRLNLARKNQRFAWHYENALQFVKEGQPALAETELEMLWDEAPYYGDPAHLAQSLSILRSPILRPTDYSEEVQQQEINAVLQEWRTRNQQEEARRQQDMLEGEPIKAFVELKLKTNVYSIWIALFCLLSGTGSAMGVLSHSLIWSVGTVSVVMILAYMLGYRKAVHLLAMIGIALVSGIIVFGAAEYGSILAVTQQSDNLWVIGSRPFWDGRQLNCGLLTGIVSVILISLAALDSYKKGSDNFLNRDDLQWLFARLIIALIIWALVSLLSTLFGWGFGFGPGWYISLIGLVIGVASGLGLFSMWIIFSKASNS